MKYIALALVLLAAGCTQLDSSTVTGMSSLDLSHWMDQARRYMILNPGDVSDEYVEEDWNFTGNILRTGKFQGMTFDASGAAGIAELDGRYYVVFSMDFEIDNGYGLGVYLSRDESYESIKRGLFLGDLKSTRSMQVYQVPGAYSIDNYNVVVVYSKKFNVPWSFAPLE